MVLMCKYTGRSKFCAHSLKCPRICFFSKIKWKGRNARVEELGLHLRGASTGRADINFIVKAVLADQMAARGANPSQQPSAPAAAGPRIPCRYPATLPSVG